MSDLTTRMAALLGRLRREMNGAVVEAMERAGVKGPLNYGVSIPTIRAIAAEAGRDHAFARFLYRQQVRELRMAALTIADPAAVTPAELDDWLAENPSVELQDELALRLLCRCNEEVLQRLAGDWVSDESPAKRYTAVMTLARVAADRRERAADGIARALERFPEDRSLARAAVAFGYALAVVPDVFGRWFASLPDTPAGRFVRGETEFLKTGC